ncbi:hypothetical protein V6N11_054507 [Hibiscus sabdariffa]|uniref:Uncharacterized protein n=1 Tax=Hibiscus sabdariffa TaxID=183260 RepID=A0ABR2S495_9ROSI
MFDELSMPTEEVSDGFDDSTVVSLEDDLIKGSSETQQLDEMLVSMGEASNANVGDIIVQLQDNMDPIDLVNMLVGCEDQFSVVQFVNQVNFHRNHLFSEYKNPVTSTWIDKFQVKQKPLLNLLRVMTHMGLLLMDENDFSRSISLAKERASSVVQNTVGMRKRQLKQKDIHISGDNTKIMFNPYDMVDEYQFLAFSRARVGGVQFELPKLGTSLGCA